MNLRVLFIASGNKFSGISNIVSAQVDSLKKEGLMVEIFAIDGKGWRSYWRSIKRLRAILKKNHYDIVHSHYSFSTWVAILAGGKNIVSSLMGSDVKASGLLRWMIRIFLIPFCRAVVVKSEEMKRDLSYDAAYVVPNGVNVQVFNSQSAEFAKKELGWDIDMLHILFPADPVRPEKNFQLLRTAMEYSGIENYVIHTLGNVSFSQMATYYNAADIVCMTSNREGSPNAIKEAMACNKLVVSTDVGDVKWLFGDTPGLFLSGHDARYYGFCVSKALEYGKNNQMGSMGRDRLLSLQLTDLLVALKLIDIYRGAK
ncbi:MAG: glycosyltransferase [Flavobacteriales bacterium]